jgi:hypothetical protein
MAAEEPRALLQLGMHPPRNESEAEAFSQDLPRVAGWRLHGLVVIKIRRVGYEQEVAVEEEAPWAFEEETRRWAIGQIEEVHEERRHVRRPPAASQRCRSSGRRTKCRSGDRRGAAPRRPQ